MFHTRKTKNGLQPYCKPCKTEYNREQRIKKKAELGVVIRKEDKFITCKKCGEEKLYTSFDYVLDKKTKKRRSVCKKCRQEQTNINKINTWLGE